MMMFVVSLEISLDISSSYMFIIPMAGLSSRFFKAGYNKPKYQLMLGKETVFSWAVKSFEKYF